LFEQQLLLERPRQAAGVLAVAHAGCCHGQQPTRQQLLILQYALLQLKKLL
jgi:hypothetical protein